MSPRNSSSCAAWKALANPRIKTANSMANHLILGKNRKPHSKPPWGNIALCYLLAREPTLFRLGERVEATVHQAPIPLPLERLSQLVTPQERGCASILGVPFLYLFITASVAIILPMILHGAVMHSRWKLCCFLKQLSKLARWPWSRAKICNKRHREQRYSQ